MKPAPALYPRCVGLLGALSHGRNPRGARGQKAQTERRQKTWVNADSVGRSEQKAGSELSGHSYLMTMKSQAMP